MKNGSGIVIEVQNKKATLLMKDGTFVSLRVPAGKRPTVGKEYQASYFSQRKRSLFVLPSISLSIAALVAFLFFSGFMPYTSKQAAAAYVSFDINPSLEVGVDEEMHVVEIDTFNNEAEHIIKKYKFSKDKSITLEEFADQLIKAYESEGYMDANHSMLITTVSDNLSDKETKKELDKALDSIVKKAVVHYPVAITVTESNEETREKAKQLGVSSGKYTTFQKANENGKAFKKEKIKEVQFQELKVNADDAASKDIKVVPHPRKIKSSQHEIKQNSDKLVLDQKKQELNNSQHNKKEQKTVMKVQKPNKIKANEKQIKKNHPVNMKNPNQTSNNKKQHEKKRETQNAVPKNSTEPKQAVKPQKPNQKGDNKQQQKQHKNGHKH
ncbi:hypothetical protein AWM68_18565 [Fictibacillus phosphorivorans]|uniref:RsgI N-terminal anti-sigma domain-containing protein n=1 Tax=Fictibacillus phosphorivorans TaxID=1221500 RepID=A0A163RYG3_9BACL|nr:hypothetical protein [Fictibacillus phosphorivorans]KZE67772.1 hypothetical protein AWM68_18565 [Fictibacillus phosphorivorans]